MSFLNIKVSFDEKLAKLTADPDCETGLKILKEDKLPYWLATSNQHHFDVLWKFNTGINPDLHKEYIDQFCSSFHDSMKGLVSRTCMNHAHKTSEIKLI